LLSPQSVIQKFGGDGGFDEFKFILKIPKFGVELHAPYGMANLPIIPMATNSPNSLWSEAFLVGAEEKDVWASNILSAKNQNLSAAKKEVLLWHQKLSHAGLSRIHNLCRQQKKVINSKEELLDLRDGPYTYRAHTMSRTPSAITFCAQHALSRKPLVGSPQSGLQASLSRRWY
jgi:hypothetical protein